MDNLCHTLTGAALAEAGLKGHTRFGSVALMIGSNLPDVDVLAFAAEAPAVAIRRGWTHGVLAQALLPLLLTGAFLLIDKWRPPAAGDRVRPLGMVLIGYVGILSHVGMDWLNTYGVRLLMPISREWFYGDAVFIVDPWLWLILTLGVFVSRRVRRPAAARWAVAAATLYVVAMIVSARSARAKVVDAWVQAKGAPPAAVMVGPAPIAPLRKSIIVDAGDHYERGSFEWWPVQVRFDPRHVPKNHRHPAAVRAAAIDPVFRGVLVWSRFPYYEIAETGDGGTHVTLADMRFTGRGRGMFTARRVVGD